MGQRTSIDAVASVARDQAPTIGYEQKLPLMNGCLVLMEYDRASDFGIIEQIF